MMLGVLRGPVTLPPRPSSPHHTHHDAENDVQRSWSSSLATRLRLPWRTAKQPKTVIPSVVWSIVNNDSDPAARTDGIIQGTACRIRPSQQYGRDYNRIHQHGRFAHASHSQVRIWLAQSCVYCFTLLGLFATYLILTVLNKAPSREVNIILIMTSIFVGVLYFYSIIRVIQTKRALLLALTASRKPPSRLLTSNTLGWIRPQRLPTDNDDLPLHDTMFAPKIAVRVHQSNDGTSFLERDASATPLPRPGSATDRLFTPLPSLPPPAYGLWRCSVRADPALLFWHPARQSGSDDGTAPTRTRPPSYISSGEQEEHEQEGGNAPAARLEHGERTIV